MNENENDFGTLRQFLRLKRHESPPPGYFNRFSGQVISRLRTGEAVNAGHFSEVSWLLKLMKAIEFKPAFAGSFASALALLLVFGIVYADRTDSSALVNLPSAGNSSGTFAAMTPAVLGDPGQGIGLIATTNPITSLQPVASFFGSQNPLVQNVNFDPAGN